MVELRKATVSIASIFVSGHVSIGWKFQAGVRPFTTTFSVPNDTWERSLKQHVGNPVSLEIVDGRGIITTIEQLYILHIVASPKPSVTTFLVADRRWKWDRILIARTYNLSRKTGDLNFDEQTIPIAGRVTTNAYDYRPYTLQEGDTVWTAREAVQDVLLQLEPDDPGAIKFDGFSATDEFSLQNIVLRDQGDVALARMMAFVPGTNVWVDSNGSVRVINTFDVDAAEALRDGLPPATWDGDKSELIDRLKIRPRQVNVYYEREVEAVLSYSDDLTTTVTGQQNPGRDELFIENVIPTTDPTTTITEFDPETGRTETKEVPPGTWVEVRAWLEAMDAIKPQDAHPWSFKTIKTYWLAGDLEGVLMGSGIRGKDVVDTTNVLTAIRALRQNFRQTFRISRRYVQRLQDIKAVRVALLDPVTGTRMPASVWGQTCAIPSTKGIKAVARRNPDSAGMYYNIDTLPDEGERLIDRPPGPQTITFLDAEAGIFRIETLDDPYGAVSSLVPCHVVDIQGNADVPVYNLGDQDVRSVGAGMRLQGGTNEIFLSDTLEFKVMVSIVPGAPNSKAAFHVEIVDTEDLAIRFEGNKFRIQNGEGPILEMFIPSSEVTARFAWVDDVEAEATVALLIGLNEDDPTQGGLIDDPNTPVNEAIDLPGFRFVNHNREVFEHARSAAAEMMAAFADSLNGRVMTQIPRNGLTLKGNMSGATIQIASAPSAKVNAVHEFPGQAQPISRFALLPEVTRKVTLGIVRFR